MSIEELAFKDRKILANLNAIDLLDIIEFLQEDRNQWINQFTKTHNESVEIQKENQELKSQLVGTTHCFDEQEHRKLKKQLEDKEEELELVRCDLHNRTSERDGYERELNECLSKQKEFIKYLEDEKDRLSGTCDIICVSKFDEADDNLQEYKRIIGYSEDE